MKKILAVLLAVCILGSVSAKPVNSSLAFSEDPLAVKDLEEFGAAPLETETAATVPVQETVPASEETVPPTTVPVESVPDATDTLSEETVVAAEETEPPEAADPDAPHGHNGVPLYFQTDYPDEIYGMGTIASNGCSAACLAMVATYMTGHEYLPDEIGRYFGGGAENNIARLELGSETMQLPFEKATNWHQTMSALREGKIVIALMESRSLFTNSQHFIILTGFNDEGKIMVNDSYEPNYDKWDIKNGLRNGFDESDILLGYGGGWIYDKSAMPEEPFLYSEPELVRGEKRYDFELTKEEKQLLAKVVWTEARGESKKGQQAVAEVVLNRLASDRFPDTLRDVIYGENQFKSAKHLDKAKPYQLQYEAVDNALYGPYILSDDVYYFATTPKTEKIWGQIGGHIFCYAED